MQTTQQRIFWGRFTQNGDDYLLQLMYGTWLRLTDWPASITDRIVQLAGPEFGEPEQQVSILGRSGGPAMEELVAEAIVPHQDVAQRAYEIYESGRGGSALDNWLLAERQLLGV